MYTYSIDHIHLHKVIKKFQLTFACHKYIIVVTTLITPQEDDLTVEYIKGREERQAYLSSFQCVTCDYCENFLKGIMSLNVEKFIAVVITAPQEDE